MISLFEAAVLGIVQGLTEFIPVSSTAHLRIVPALVGWPDPGAAYSAVIQLGTLASLLIFFRKDLFDFTMASLHAVTHRDEQMSLQAKMPLYLVLGTIPISVFGLLFSKFITGPARSLYVISGSLIVLAIILYIADRLSGKKREMIDSLWKDYLLIGLAQSVALIPGASRSGTTLAMGLVLGFTRESSMRISFLLSIPAIGLSGLYELFKERHNLAEAGFAGLAVGTLTAGIVGYMTIAALLKYLRTHSTGIFVSYRILLGICIILMLSMSILVP